jgi:hypothetical protein
MYFHCPISGLKVWLHKVQFTHCVETSKIVLVVWLLYCTTVQNERDVTRNGYVPVLGYIDWQNAFLNWAHNKR